MSSTGGPSAILTAAPASVDFALAELTAIDPGARLLAELEAGILLIAGDLGFFGLAEEWRARPPIFVRHMSPVLEAIPLDGDESDPARLIRHLDADLIDLIDPQLSFSVQTRILTALPYKPYDVNSALADHIVARAGVELDVRHPQQVLSVVCARNAMENSHTELWCYMGLSLAVQNLSDWAGGMRRFARETGQVSRSEFKLLEALEVFDLALQPRGSALDLGASPGGWTRVLRRHGQYVTAIDPGDLHPSLAADSQVRHKRTTAQAYLEEGPDSFDLIVNDMRMDARDSARLMVRYARQLYPGGLVIMTLKLPEQGRRKVIDHALSILAQAYTISGARQLFHNRSEITVLLRPLDRP